jgi:hypothetical protein
VALGAIETQLPLGWYGIPGRDLNRLYALADCVLDSLVDRRPLR